MSEMQNRVDYVTRRLPDTRRIAAVAKAVASVSRVIGAPLVSNALTDRQRCHFEQSLARHLRTHGDVQQ